MAHLNIIHKAPEGWKELQQFCSYILNDCGFEAMIEKKIPTVRGIVEVDVFAEKKGAYNNRILCECKHWNSRVPKTIVHAFRTVMEDCGANQGILISKKGFQKGSYEAVKDTNMSLFTWLEFQDAFKMDYLHFVIDRNFKKGHELMVKADRILDKYNQHSYVLTQNEFDDFQWLREAYFDVLLYSFRDNYEDFDTRKVIMKEVEIGMEQGMKSLHIKLNSFKEYFDFIYIKCQEEIGKLDVIIRLVEERLNQNGRNE